MYNAEKLYEVYKTGNYIKLSDMLAENVKEYAARKACAKVSDISIIKKFTTGESNPKFCLNHKTDIFGGSWNCFLDGHRIFADRDNDFGMDAAGDKERFNFLPILKEMDMKKMERVYIDKKDLETFIRLNKKEDYIPYKIRLKNGFITGFNPKYIKDTLAWMATDYIEVQSENFERYPQLFMKNDNRFCFVLPIAIKPDARPINVDNMEEVSA